MNLAELLVAVIAAPFLVAFIAICMRDPLRVTLPVFAALIPFGDRFSVGSSPFASPSSLVGMLLGLGLVVRLALGRRGAPRLSPAVPVWLLFLACAAASTLWTLDLAATVSGVGVLASLILVFVLVAISGVDRTVLRRTENGLLFGGVAVVCYGLFQLLVLGGFPNDKTGGLPVAASGRFGNDLLGPDIESISLLLPLVLALSRAFGEGSRMRRTGYAAVAVMMVLGVLMTGSRAGTLALGVVVLVLAATGPRRARRPLLATFLVAAAIAAAVWVYHPAGIADRTFTTATSSSGRTDIWKVGLKACERYCGPGSGWGTFPDVYAETQATVPGARVLVGPQGTYQAHNLWLLIGVELGVVGLVLFMVGLGIGVAECRELPRALRGPPSSALAGLCFGVFFLSSMEFKFFWMVFIMVALNRNVVESERRSAAPVAVPGSVAGGEPPGLAGVPPSGP